MPVIKHGKSEVNKDKPWDAGENVKRLKEGESQAYYDKMFMWRDADAYRGKTDVSHYKFPFHFVEADGDIGEASLKAASAIIASLNGERNKPDIPESDVHGVYEQAVKVYKDAGVDTKDIPDLKENSASGHLRVLQKINQYEHGVELWIMRDGLNQNDWDFRNIQDHYLSFLGRPILCAYVGGEVGDGHNKREKTTTSGIKYYTFTDGTAERIVGTISEDPKDLTLVKEGGHTWIVAKGRLFAFYAPELVEKIVRTGRMDVSSETDIKESHTEGNIEIETAWAGLGVTILGDRVPPAIPGAHIKNLAAIESEFKELKLRAASLNNPDAGQNLHKSSDEGVKNTMNFANRVQIDKLASVFPDYRVMAASEDGMKVCLLSKNGAEAYTYIAAESDQGVIIKERIKPVALSASYRFKNGTEMEEMEVPIDSITSEMSVQLASLTKQVKDLTEDRDGLKTKLAAMEEDKKARNTKTAKDAATARLMEINANKSCEAEKIADECIAELMASIDKGEYATCENPDVAAKKAVDAAAMTRQMEIDKKKTEAMRAAQQQKYAFEEGFFGKNTGTGSVLDEAAARIMK